jgi:tetratricopeptide (TPR) repeat protein
MMVRALTFFSATLFASALFGMDENRLALVARAQADFDRVVLAPAPTLHDTNICIQSQAALIPVATPEEAPVFQFRKGYCTLAAALVTREPNAFLQAASAFDQAIAAWPARGVFLIKKVQPEPLPSVLPVLASVARLSAGKGDAKPIAAAIAVPVCNETLTTVQTCSAIFQTGREWLAWSALQRDDIEAASREVPAASTAWASWVAGKRAFKYNLYADAAAAFRRAVEAWDAQSRAVSRPVRERLGPMIDRSVAYAEFGGAQLLAGDSAAALATLNQAVRHDSTNARALFLRGRARDAAGQADAAIADYSLAARNALAKADEGASGDAHVYRGISFYRRKAFSRAEEEFNSALNFEIAPAMRADAIAWRRLASVAGGSCIVGPAYLQEAMPAASPFFPREEARATVASCSSTASAQRSR